MDTLQIIRQKLKWGDLLRIAQATGYSQTAVSNTLNGKTQKDNEKIIEQAIIIIEERRKKEIKLQKRIGSLLDSA